MTDINRIMTVISAHPILEMTSIVIYPIQRVGNVVGFTYCLFAMANC